MIFSKRSVCQLAATIGLGYFVVFATAQIIGDWLSGTIPFFDYYHIPFIILFIASIIFVWVRPRFGYLLTVVTGLVGVGIFTPFTFR